MTFKNYKRQILEDIRAKKLDFSIDGRKHYVYRISKNFHYYGSRTSAIEPIKDLGRTYFTSGTLSEDFKSNTLSYKIKILKIFDNVADKMIYEAYLHQCFNVKTHDKFANKSNQTPFGFDTTGTTLSKEHKNKISIAISGNKNGFYGKTHTKETRKIMKQKQAYNFKARENKRDGIRKNRKSTKGEKRGTYSQTRKNNIAKSRENKSWYYMPGTTYAKYVSDIVAPCYTLFGWQPGRGSNGTQSWTKRKVCPHCHKESNAGNYAQHHGSNCKMNDSFWEEW